MREGWPGEQSLRTTTNKNQSFLCATWVRSPQPQLHSEYSRRARFSFGVDEPSGCVALGRPSHYLSFLMSKMSVLIVREKLVMAPFLNSRARFLPLHSCDMTASWGFPSSLAHHLNAKERGMCAIQRCLGEPVSAKHLSRKSEYQTWSPRLRGAGRFQGTLTTGGK